MLKYYLKAAIAQNVSERGQTIKYVSTNQQLDEKFNTRVVFVTNARRAGWGRS